MKIKNLKLSFFAVPWFVASFICSMAQAELGENRGCYTMALTIPSSLTDTDAKTVVLPTQGVLCTTEKNMRSVGIEGQLKTGDIKIRIFEKKKIVAQFEFSYSFGEGAAGTHYVSYAKNQEDLLPQEGDMDKSKVVIFAMRNDRVQKGEIAGRIEINGLTHYLLQR